MLPSWSICVVCGGLSLRYNNSYIFLVNVLQKEDEQLKLGSEAASSSEEQLSESELGIDELQLLLQAMQFRRYSIWTVTNLYTSMLLQKSVCFDRAGDSGSQI